MAIKADIMLDKAVLTKDDGGELTAMGVVAVGEDGCAVEFKAKSEVIACAGAYCGPAIPMRSSIWSKEELSKHN